MLPSGSTCIFGRGLSRLHMMHCEVTERSALHTFAKNSMQDQAACSPLQAD